MHWYIYFYSFILTKNLKWDTKFIIVCNVTPKNWNDIFCVDLLSGWKIWEIMSFPKYILYIVYQVFTTWTTSLTSKNSFIKQICTFFCPYAYRWLLLQLLLKFGLLISFFNINMKNHKSIYFASLYVQGWSYKSPIPPYSITVLLVMSV